MAHDQQPRAPFFAPPFFAAGGIGAGFGADFGAGVFAADLAGVGVAAAALRLAPDFAFPPAFAVLFDRAIAVRSGS